MVYDDSETGFRFTSYENDKGVIYRVALSRRISDDKPYDVVVQIVAPISTGWAGLAWGGQMIANPLAVIWRLDQQVLGVVAMGCVTLRPSQAGSSQR
jgi:hypothetical protein